MNLRPDLEEMVQEGKLPRDRKKIEQYLYGKKPRRVIPEEQGYPEGRGATIVFLGLAVITALMVLAAYYTK